MSGRRSVLHSASTLALLGFVGPVLSRAEDEPASADLGTDSVEVEFFTNVTYEALVDALIPETPELGEKLGPEHVPGGLEVDLDEFVRTYLNNVFQFGLPFLGTPGNIPLAVPVAILLDKAALTLILFGANESDPRREPADTLTTSTDLTPEAFTNIAGPFALLGRKDRLRAIDLLDEFVLELDQFGVNVSRTRPGSMDAFLDDTNTMAESTHRMAGNGSVFLPIQPRVPEYLETTAPIEEFAPDVSTFDNVPIKIHGGLVGTLVVAFTELIYYSEWEGYDDFFNPPSELEHPNDPEELQSWQQSGYPGVSNGYAALRGYLGSEESSLGEGEPWTVIDEDADDPVTLMRERGSFTENDYDTSGYEEPYPEEGI